MKKILFAANTLDIGGIETALVTLLNYLESQDKYEITLALEQKKGALLWRLSPNIKVIEYAPSKSKNIIVRKIKNFIKRAKFIIEHKNKYDFSAAYATYSLPASFIARTASSNNALWVHNNYLTFFNNNKDKYINYFGEIHAQEFKNIVFVSKEAKEIYSQIFGSNESLVFCNNLIDYKNILLKAKEKIKLEKGAEPVFINVGRHDEQQKRLSRLINVAKKLRDNNYKFKILLVGSGQDESKYMEMIKEYKLEEYITMCGMQKNPYPYFDMADCVVLTSDYEGYPVVFVEAMTLGKPIITTNVSDSKTDIEQKWGFVCEKTEDDIYEKMKCFIEHGYEIKEKFNPKEFNEEIIEKIDNLIG